MPRTTFAYPDSAFEPASCGTATRMGLLPLLHRFPLADPLDRYVEAHVHGGVRVPAEIEALVLDPAYRDHLDVGQAAQRGIPIEWHGGYRLDIAVLTDNVDYRGPDVIALAGVLAVDGVVRPPDLGRARRAGADPQVLKRLWHCVARFGRQAPITPAAARRLPDQ